jgi:hypothetical protein
VPTAAAGTGNTASRCTRRRGPPRAHLRRAQVLHGHHAGRQHAAHHWLLQASGAHGRHGYQAAAWRLQAHLLLRDHAQPLGLHQLRGMTAHWSAAALGRGGG